MTTTPTIFGTSEHQNVFNINKLIFNANTQSDTLSVSDWESFRAFRAKGFDYETDKSGSTVILFL